MVELPHAGNAPHRRRQAESHRTCALDGTPDLSGVWMHEITTVAEVRRLFGTAFEDAIKVDVPGMEIGTQHKYAFDILLDQKPEESIMRPEAMEILRQHRRASAFEDPASVCTGVIGFPLAGLLSEPIKIVQAPRLTMILYEAQNLRRQIYTDGRTLPKEVNLPAYMGYSAGHWERDTLVVETAGFNDKTTLDALGTRMVKGSTSRNVSAAATSDTWTSK